MLSFESGYITNGKYIFLPTHLFINEHKIHLIISAKFIFVPQGPAWENWETRI